MNLKWLSRLFTEDKGLKIASLLIAITLWLRVVSAEQTEALFRVPLTLANMPAELVLVSNVPQSINVRLRGPRTIMSSVDQRKLNFTLDLTGMQDGTSTYEILSSKLGLPRGLEVSQLSPSKVTLQTDKKDVRVLDVTPRISGTPGAGYEIADVVVRPPKVEIEGSERALKLAREVPTEVLDVSGLTGPMVREVQLVPSDPTFKPLKQQGVVVEVKIREMIGERGFLQVVVESPRTGWVTRPPTVEVRLKGNLTLLSRLEAKDIKATALWDGKGSSEEGPVHSILAVDAPAGAELVSVTPSEVLLVRDAKVNP